jgi:hypothetical protein
MSIPLAEIRVDRPTRFGSLTVFPLFCEGNRPVEYLLSDEGMEAGTVTISEVTQRGSVPELIVENKSSQRLLLIEGEELHGAKQNRILNTTVLVPALSQLTIPVSCVEQGRCQRVSTFFFASKTVSPSRLRHTLKSSVARSLKEKRGHRSDQGQVWDEVRKQQEALGVSSGTSALADTYAKYEAQRAEAQNNLRYTRGACGLAVALGARLVSVDLFDKPATWAKVWGRLLSGLVLDALEDGGQAETAPDLAQVSKLVNGIRDGPWMRSETVGDGQELRAEFDGMTGSALLLDGALVHGSVVGGLA